MSQPSSSAPVLFITTGRSGSTMMQGIINSHPDICGISELLTFCGKMTDETRMLHDVVVDGKEFWRHLSWVHPPIRWQMRNDVAQSEIIYPFKSDSSMFNAETGVPAICLTALPALTDRIDELYREVERVVEAYPAQHVRDHYEQLFDWLRVRFDRKQVIERSGASAQYADDLLNLWPDTKYIHLVRNGMDTCWSMLNQHGFKTYLIKQQIEAIIGVDPYVNSDRSRAGELPEELRTLLPENITREKFLAYDIPLKLIGEVWSDMMVDAMQMLSKLPAEQVLHIDYDRFCHDPVTQIRALVNFSGVKCTDEWARTATRNVRPNQGGHRKLSADDQAELAEALEPGATLLKQLMNSGQVL